MNIKDFKVGQKVYVELTGNASRGKTAEECIEEWEITSVGRKYIEAGRIDKKRGGVWGKHLFEYKENYGRFVEKTNYCIDYALYLTRQEIEDKQEKSRIFKEVSEVFRGFGAERNITLEQLRRIKKILNEETENQNANP